MEEIIIFKNVHNFMDFYLQNWITSVGDFCKTSFIAALK